MEIVFALEEIKRGDVVMLNEQGHLVKYRVATPVGIAARDLRKGNPAKLDRGENTDDILVKTASKP